MARNDEIRVKFKIDSNTNEIVLLNKEVNKLGKSFNNAETFANTFMKRINLGGHILIGYQAFKQTLGDIISNGIRVNREFENINNSLSTMIMVSSKNVDSLGNQLSAMDKQTRAGAEAGKMMEKLLEINAKTPHTFNQTAELFDAMYLGMRKVGASTEDMVEITEKLSIAVGNKVSFDAMLSAMDGLSTGTVEVSSDMGRFLNAIGLSNEEIKNSVDVVDLFKEKLSGFKAIESFDTRVSNLTNSFDLLSKTVAEPLFDSFYDSMIPAAQTLDSLNKKLIDYRNNIEKIQDVHKQTNIKILQDELRELEDKFERAKLATTRFYNKFSTHDEAEVKKLELLIKTTKRRIERLKEIEENTGATVYDFDDSEIKDLVNKTLNPYQAGLDDINKKWQVHFNLMKKNGKDTTGVMKAWNKEIEEYNKKTSEANKKKIKDEFTPGRNLKTSLSDLQNYYKSVGDIENAWLIEQMNISDKFSDLTDEQYSNAYTIAKKEFYEKLEKERIQLVVDSPDYKQIDIDANFAKDAIDSQLELIDATDSWGNSLDGVAGNIGNVMGAMQQLSKVGLLSQKEQIEIDAEWAKAKEKYSEDSIEYVEAENDWINKTSKNKVDAQNAEIAGYANLAGAMAGAFEQGSAGAIAFQTIQATLGIASSWTAIAEAWALPWPSNLAAVAMVASNVMPIIGQLSSMGGSGGGASASSIGQAQVDTRIEEIEAYYEPITNRLDQQIELLESIDRNGSASALQNELAQITFTRDSQLWKEDVFKGSFLGELQTMAGGVEEAVTEWEKILGFNVFDFNNDKVKLDLDSLRESNNLINALSNIIDTNAYAGGLGQNATDNIGDATDQRAWLDKMVSEYQGLVNDWAISIIDSMSELTDASDSFKESFDAITGSTYYETKRLNEAFEQVNILISSSNSGNIENYLSNMINSIDEAEKFLTEDRFNLLLSKNIEDIEAQTALLEEFSAVTGQTFENGAKAALDYIDAIDLVTEALETSASNITSFLDGFKTDYQLVNNQANKLGLTVASTMSELFAQYELLKSDMLGLTDQELTYLESAKDYIESKNDELLESQQNSIQTQIDNYNEFTNTVKTDISTVTNILSSLENVIDKLKTNSLGSTYTLSAFRNSMQEAIALSTTSNYSDYQSALNKAIGYSDSLFDASNFTSQYDMQFAQAVALNQFEGLETTSLDQLDYLQMIEENTKNTVSALTAELQGISNNISSSNSTLADSIANSVGASDFLTDTIQDKYDLILNKEADDASVSYWANQILDDNISTNNLGIALGAAAVENGEMSLREYIDQIYNIGMRQEPTNEDVSYWMNQNIPISNLASVMAQAFDENQIAIGSSKRFNSFDVGTANVTQDQLAWIHKGEMIPTAPMSEGIRNGDLTLGNNKEQIDLLKSIDNRLKALEQSNKNTKDIVDNTRKTRIKVSA